MPYLFWNHDWGRGVLKFRFEILFTYTLNENVTLAETSEMTQLQQLFRSNMSPEAHEQLEMLQQVMETNPVTITSEPDSVIWKWDQNGKFTVKSAYWNIKNGPLFKTKIQRIWKLKVPPRIIVFAWLMCLNRLLTIDNLKKRGWELVNRCEMCKRESETVRHLFNSCQTTLAIYRQTALLIGLVQGIPVHTQALLQRTYTRKTKEIMIISRFVVWRERCSRIFKGTCKDVNDLAREIQEEYNAAVLTATRLRQQTQ